MTDIQTNNNTLTNPLLARVKMPGETYTLPSRCVFYTNGELTAEAMVDGEVHVHPMTVLDEIVLKTPDLLFSGQAVRDVFARCIPAVLKPNMLLAKDVDFLLLCLRKVSYGNEIELKSLHEDCGITNPSHSAYKEGSGPTEHTYRVSVPGFINESKHIDPTTLDQLYRITLPNDQVVRVKPITYASYIQMMQVQDKTTNAPPSEQVRAFADSLSSVIESVDDITDQAMIKGWLAEISPAYVTQMTDVIERGAQWGPDYTQTVVCKDCGESMKIHAPTNPLIFFS